MMHPQILYWFIQHDTLDNQQYRKDIDHIAEKSPFSMLFLTERDNASFYDIKTMHPIFSDLVSYAHEKGLQVGLQLWPEAGWSGRIQEPRAPRDALQGIMVDATYVLGNEGEIQVQHECLSSRGALRWSPCCTLLTCSTLRSQAIMTLLR